MPQIMKIWKKKLPILFLLLLAFLLVTCGKNGKKSARSGFYIEEPSRGNAGESPSAKTPQICYFFDRTTSMQGYVSKNNSEYARIIPQLWMVAESSALWPGSETGASFYKFGEGDIRKLSREYVRDNVRRRDFYETPGEGRPAFSTNDKQVFATAAKYIASESSPDKLFIVVTDLYEQNREDNCFSALFRNAFEHGMSGAIIAIQSGFDGSIENISDNKAANIKVNGISTFFIFIIGQRDILLKYCGAFFANADFLSLKSEKTLFLLGDGSAPSELPWTPAIKKANSEKNFERIANNNNINLKVNIPRLFTVKGNPVDPMKVESFRLLGNVRSQYVGGLPIKNIDFNSFSFEPSYTVEYCKGDKNTESDLSVFEIKEKEKANFIITAINGGAVNDMDSSRYPLAVVINAKNDSLNKGCYRINYEIFQRAKIPQWVADRNAGTLDELKDSIKPDTAVKILRLESIYKYIAEAYNKQFEWGKVYSDSLYLEKQR
jgi:hypothetical protein